MRSPRHLVEEVHLVEEALIFQLGKCASYNREVSNRVHHT